MINREVARLNAFIRGGLKPNSLAALAFALVCIAVATLVRGSIDLVAPQSSPFVTYFPAIMIATLVGGWAAGLVALFGSLVEAWYLFVPPRHQWVAANLDHVVTLALFVIPSLIIVWVSEQFRRIIRQLDDEEHYRQLVVDELAHRVKNKLATIYAILRHELRAQPGLWDSVSGRLRALSATDDFLVKSKYGRIDLHRILTQELAPYDANRVCITGEPLEVPSKLAVVLSLILHELSTNAAKYGALSVPEGRLDISWRSDNDNIALDWVESGGPPVGAPAKRSFGTNLIERSLDAFGGNARIEFVRTGVVCRMSFPKAATVADEQPDTSRFVA